MTNKSLEMIVIGHAFKKTGKIWKDCRNEDMFKVYTEVTVDKVVNGR